MACLGVESPIGSGSSRDDVADTAGFARERRIGFDDLEHFVVGGLGVGFVDGVLNERAFEAELGALVDHVDTLIVERKNRHGLASTLAGKNRSSRRTAAG